MSILFDIFNANILGYEYRLLITIILALNLHRYLKFRKEFSHCYEEGKTIIGLQRKFNSGFPLILSNLNILINMYKHILIFVVTYLQCM